MLNEVCGQVLQLNKGFSRTFSVCVFLIMRLYSTKGDDITVWLWCMSDNITIMEYPMQNKSSLCLLILIFWLHALSALQWHHNERNGISNQQLHYCLLNHLFKAQIKENKALCHWPLWGEFTGDQWIPCTKGQLRRKCFHLMTSSWCHHELWTRWPHGHVNVI